MKILPTPNRRQRRCLAILRAFKDGGRHHNPAFFQHNYLIRQQASRIARRCSLPHFQGIPATQHTWQPPKQAPTNSLLHSWRFFHKPCNESVVLSIMHSNLKRHHF